MLWWTQDKTSLFKNSIHLLINLLHGWVSSAGSCCTNDQSTGTLSNQWGQGRLGSIPNSVQLVTEISTLGTELKSKLKRKYLKNWIPIPDEGVGGRHYWMRLKERWIEQKCEELIFSKTAYKMLLMIFQSIAIITSLV